MAVTVSQLAGSFSRIGEDPSDKDFIGKCKLCLELVHTLITGRHRASCVMLHCVVDDDCAGPTKESRTSDTDDKQLPSNLKACKVEIQKLYVYEHPSRMCRALQT